VENFFLVQIEGVHRQIIAFLSLSVITIGATEPISALELHPFASSGVAVQIQAVADAPTLPQLRRTVEAGLDLTCDGIWSMGVSAGAFLTDPSIPTGMISYRGYYGALLRIMVDHTILSSTRSAFFISGMGAVELAQYANTELAFLAFEYTLAPGIRDRSAALGLNIALPLALEVRGDIISWSFGLRYSLAIVPRKAEK
jgi:hypothetical protein